MEKENSNLIIRDLMGRLIYNVRLNIKSTAMEFETNLKGIVINDQGDCFVNHDFNVDVYSIKPYLRPMSSMTEEEQEEFAKFHCVNICPMILTDMLTLGDESKMFDWLNEHHFDYNGLIEKGLALEAPEGMYKID